MTQGLQKKRKKKKKEKVIRYVYRVGVAVDLVSIAHLWRP